MFKQHTKYTHVSTCIAYDSFQFSFLFIFLVISEKNNSYSWFFIISPFTFLQVFIIPTERIACIQIKNMDMVWDLFDSEFKYHKHDSKTDSQIRSFYWMLSFFSELLPLLFFISSCIRYREIPVCMAQNDDLPCWTPTVMPNSTIIY